ncbi:MAG: (2Fe-2S)-binding protein [Clostridium beijerinckii]|jgi:carbon-monoxide dehydrogenase small subunit|uniref:Ferredoxin n=1 Tax=Clostridium beijerinckii TaxID=1520 RepID=A0A1S9N5L5_CLOBE|nr:MULTISPECIES: (2Fe-2S)-binding protein [Clostridium]MBN7573006.1 (2Fe-2S)-binding protein [Clostridium beijerinckii]MBN7578192.1 (2Fe-2S)-binding protein [Clostridium beijerinckii]MBN7582780.1 (2Fe-2S)-binding protein [Clostridium beijerinckii]MBO0521669.1 (2Fe-2S)-binding protein [Clostridium beijerinckii]MCI1478377.1 (2Fe-2S)-binding protein [Clostridium beijerinckii]
MSNTITLKINNKTIATEESSAKRLLDFLREDLDITGPKEGCGEGECGACAVIIDKELINSCLVTIGSVQGKEIITVEGLKGTKQFGVLERCFAEAGAVQCGFCTPGMIMAAHALLSKIPRPTEDDVRNGISGNLCRCTGYNMIINAILMASKRGDGLW